MWGRGPKSPSCPLYPRQFPSAVSVWGLADRQGHHLHSPANVKPPLTWRAEPDSRTESLFISCAWPVSPSPMATMTESHKLPRPPLFLIRVGVQVFDACPPWEPLSSQMRRLQRALISCWSQTKHQRIWVIHKRKRKFLLQSHIQFPHGQIPKASGFQIKNNIT